MMPATMAIHLLKKRLHISQKKKQYSNYMDIRFIESSTGSLDNKATFLVADRKLHL